MMKKVSSKNLISGLVAGVLMVAGNAAFAATQGSVGATSSGSININAEVTQQVKISGLTDMTIDYGNWDGINNLTTSENVCVWSNSNGQYNITATGSGTGDIFTITDGTDALAYTVEWTDDNSTEALSASTNKTGMTGANHGRDCGTGGDSASLDVIFASSVLSTASAGTYSGTLTLVVAPE